MGIRRGRIGKAVGLAALAAVSAACGDGDVAEEAVAERPGLRGPAGDLHGFVEDVMDRGATPGLALAVVVGDEVDYVQGFGTSDPATDAPVDARTIFYIASSTKSFTGTAAAILDAEGRIDLDAPLSTYLPDVRLAPPLSADSITLRALLTHTHGMDNGGPIVLRTAYTGVHDRATLLSLLEAQPAGDQGTGFEYGNLGYNVASLALDAELGESWKDLLDERIFRPLGMRRTTAYMSRADAELLAKPYRWTPEGWEARPYAKRDANMHAAGGMLSNVADLSRWIAANLNGGRLDGRQAIPSAAIAEAQTVHAANDDAWGPFTREGYGLGWHAGHYDGVRQIHHFGGFPGFHTHVSMLPDERIGVVVLVNESFLGSAAATVVAAFAYDAYLRRPDLDERRAALLAELDGELERMREAVTRDRERRAARPQELPRPLEAYAGVYENDALGRLEWDVVEGALRVRAGVVESEVEVYDGEADQLRVELTGGGSVASFDFPAGADRAAAVEVSGYRFERVSD